jgi:hypothetical protein
MAKGTPETEAILRIRRRPSRLRLEGTKPSRKVFSSAVEDTHEMAVRSLEHSRAPGFLRHTLSPNENDILRFWSHVYVLITSQPGWNPTIDRNGARYVAPSVQSSSVAVPEGLVDAPSEGLPNRGGPSKGQVSYSPRTLDMYFLASRWRTNHRIGKKSRLASKTSLRVSPDPVKSPA